jgi:UDP-GlcNAc:undecaprenyl-phosphate GlcNAc-1-phosphate transferase
MSRGLLLVLILTTVLPSFFISLVMVAVVRRWAERLGLMDRPGVRKVHSHPIPLGGGIGIWLAVLLTFLCGGTAVWLLSQNMLGDLRSSLNIPEDVAVYFPGMVYRLGQMLGLLVAGTVLMILGLADDRYGLKWQIRLGVEFAVAAFVVFGLGMQLTAFLPWNWIAGVISVVWIVALVNSFNMLDNMDGLSGGVAAIAATMLAIMLLSTPAQPQIFVAAMLLVLVGGLLGFLVHNWPPAKIFMGDAGSYFVGFWIACCTLLATYAGSKTSQPHAILAPVFVLAIPLYDMISVIIIRVSEGRSPFEGDKRHFSHRLVEMGLTKKQAVLTIYLATATCGLGALLLPRVDAIGAVIVSAIVLCALGLIRILESQAWEKNN